MKGWIATVVAAVAAFAVGMLVGGGAGGLVGSGAGALTGAHLGACKAALVAAEKGLVDQATADRIARETLAELERVAPEVVKSGATDLASCRTQAGMDMLAG
jgi:uncharacterized protein YcfJ